MKNNARLHNAPFSIRFRGFAVLNIEVAIRMGSFSTWRSGKAVKISLK